MKQSAAIKIRQETKKDYSAVYEVNQQAFGQDSEARLVDTLRLNATAFVTELSLVATMGDRIIGHILFTRLNIKSESGNLHESLGLAPMAVRPDMQKMGVGGQLINHGFEVVKNMGFKSVIVLGHEHYYPKFGFQPAEKWHIKAPFKVPSTVFMAIELVKDGLKNVTGTVVYPIEFQSV